MESGGAAGGGPTALLPVLFHAEYLARVRPLPFTSDFFFFRQEHTCRPFHSHSFSNEEVRAGSCLTQIPFFDPPSTWFSLKIWFRTLPDLTIAFLSVAKSK